MGTLTGFCGLKCDGCPALVATRTNDAGLRAETATKWSAMYHAELKPDDIHCVGCTVPGPHFAYCESMCGIRKCGMGRSLGTCADCPDYACQQLQDFFEMVPDARATLDALRAGR